MSYEFQFEVYKNQISDYADKANHRFGLSPVLGAPFRAAEHPIGTPVAEDAEPSDESLTTFADIVGPSVAEALFRAYAEEGATEDRAAERQRFKDHTYLEMARLQARLSKDPSTQVGAVVLDRRGVVKGTGYNGFARGVEDSTERLDDREVKLMLTRHAEPNALWAAGPNAEGGTIYVTHHPCARCAADIVQHGVVKVVIPAVDDLGVRWAEDRKWAKVQFDEAGVEVVEL